MTNEAKPEGTKTDAKKTEKAKWLVAYDYEKNPKNRAIKSQAFREFIVAPERQARLKRLSQGRLNLDQMVEIVLAAISKTPMIAACSTESLALALSDAAELGLLPSSTMGMAHLVPFQNTKKAALYKVPEFYEAKLIPDYKGLAHLARESGSVLSISAGVIYGPVEVGGKILRHEFEMLEGSEDRLVVKPLPPGHTQQDKDMIYAWASCKIPAPSVPQGFVVQWVYLTRAEVLKIKASSRASSNGPWVTWESEMWKKTGVKRLSKLAPRKGLFARALEIDDAAEAEPEEIEVNAVGSPTRTKGTSRAHQLLSAMPEATGFEEPGAGDAILEGLEREAATEADPRQANLLDGLEQESAGREPTDEELEAEKKAKGKK